MYELETSLFIFMLIIEPTQKIKLMNLMVP